MILQIDTNRSIEVEAGTNTIGLGLDDDGNLCSDNDYNGDHAYFSLNAEQAQSLIDMLQNALNEIKKS